MKYIAAFIVIAFFASCSNTEVESEKIKETNEHLISSIQNKNTQINDLLNSIKEIRDNLDDAKKSQGLILAAYDNQETPVSLKKTIIEDIELLHQLIEDSKWDIEDLEKKIKSKNARNEELEIVLSSLKMNLAERDKEIRQLKEQMFDWNAEFERINDILNEKVVEGELLKQEMNKVYFACGTYKELKGKGVVEKKGPVFGLLGNKDLRNNFNKTYFTEGDLNEIESIPIMAKKLEIVTPHHEDSFYIETNSDNLITELVIVDKDKFWENSKFLTIVINQ